MTNLKPGFKEKIEIYSDFPHLKKNRMIPLIAMRIIADSRPDDYAYMDVNWLARVLKVNVSFLSKRYKKSYKVTIQQDIIERRVLWATRFLVEDPEMSIEEIAKKLHYCNGNYFIKVFKKEKNITPQQFRIRYRNAPPEIKEKYEVSDKSKQIVVLFWRAYDSRMKYIKCMLQGQLVYHYLRQKKIVKDFPFPPL